MDITGPTIPPGRCPLIGPSERNHPMTDAPRTAKRTTVKDPSRGSPMPRKPRCGGRARELKAESRRGAERADGERDLLAKIAEMPKSDRVMAERIHAIVRPTRRPSRRKPGTGCRPMPATARSSASSRGCLGRGTRRSASRKTHTSTTHDVVDVLGALTKLTPRRRGADRCAREESSQRGPKPDDEHCHEVGGAGRPLHAAGQP